MGARVFGFSDLIWVLLLFFGVLGVPIGFSRQPGGVTPVSSAPTGRLALGVGWVRPGAGSIGATLNPSWQAGALPAWAPRVNDKRTDEASIEVERSMTGDDIVRVQEAPNCDRRQPHVSKDG